MVTTAAESRIQEGLEQAQQGIFVPEEEMEVFLSQYADKYSGYLLESCNPLHGFP